VGGYLSVVLSALAKSKSNIRHQNDEVEADDQVLTIVSDLWMVCRRRWVLMIHRSKNKLIHYVRLERG